VEKDLKEKLSMLIHLAHSDGEFSIQEKAFIYNVGLRHGVDLDTIGDLIEHPLEPEVPQNLTHEQRIEYMTQAMLLMLVDGKMLPKEIEFCIKIGEHLGYDPKSIKHLIADIIYNLNISGADLKSKIEQLTLSTS
jgi:hypothetical protein